MRYVKALILALFLLAVMIVLFQNTETFGQTMTLSVELFEYKWTSVPLPFYILVLAAGFLGFFITLLYFFMDKMKTSSDLKKCQRRVASLEKEVNSLRTMPLEDQGYSSSQSSEESGSELGG
jgi:uncharacterized protein YoxC